MSLLVLFNQPVSSGPPSTSITIDISVGWSTATWHNAEVGFEQYTLSTINRPAAINASEHELAAIAINSRASWVNPQTQASANYAIAWDSVLTTLATTHGINYNNVPLYRDGSIDFINPYLKTIATNSGMGWSTPFTQIERHGLVFYTVEANTIGPNCGIYWTNPSNEVGNIYGINYTGPVLATISSDKAINFNRYAPISISKAYRLGYIQNTQLFVFTTPYIYNQKDLTLAVNQIADGANTIKVTSHGVVLDYTYNHIFSTYADNMVIDMSPVLGYLTDPDTITLTLLAPIATDNGVITTDLIETRSNPISPYSEAAIASIIEIRDPSDILVTTLVTNQVTTFTSDAYTLWYGRYYTTNLRSPVFVRLNTAPINFTLSLVCGGRTYIPTTDLQQIHILEPDNSITMSIVIDNVTDSNLSESVALEFYTMKPALTSIQASSNVVTSQPLNLNYLPDYVFTINVNYATITSLTELLKGMGVYENMHV